MRMQEVWREDKAYHCTGVYADTAAPLCITSRTEALSFSLHKMHYAPNAGNSDNSSVYRIFGVSHY